MRHFSNSTSKQMKRKLCNSADSLYRSLPRVPSTQFLESTKLTNDILFSGYRPITYPVKENPLFRSSNKKLKKDLVLQQETARAEAADQQEQEHFNILTGYRGTGGIMSGGVNGTWRFNPKVPSNLLPYNCWSTSVMCMEYYPEWNSIPPRVIRSLKPYSVSVMKIDKK